MTNDTKTIKKYHCSICKEFYNETEARGFGFRCCKKELDCEIVEVSADKGY